jgi:hypothetical protein
VESGRSRNYVHKVTVRPRALEELTALATRYSGRTAHPEDRIYADLDINGSDFIEFVEEIERRFGVDLSWVSPRGGKVEAQDPTIETLAEVVRRQTS